MLHAQQNDERSAERAGIKTDSNGWTQLLRCVGLGRRKEDLIAGAARRKREPSQLGGLTFQTVLVDSQTSDFRFKRLPPNPEFRSRA